MIQDVKRLCLEFDPEPFRNGEPLQSGYVDVVYRIQLQGVATRVGQSTKPSLNVLSIGIVRRVRHDV